MGQLTPSFMIDLETNMRVITLREYERLTQNLWWERVARAIPSQSKKERISWLLDTAKIYRTTHGGGQMIFDDIVMQSVEYENENAAAGLELKKEQLEDLDGNGVQLAAHWARQMGAYAAYWPQKEVARMIRDNPVGYDGVNFFAANHPINPFNVGAGLYANLFTGASSGIYPGAVPIDDSVTVDVAVRNLAKVIAYASSVKMPNGEDPRFLRVATILVPPALVARAQQITNAKTIAQAATSGGGGADVEAVIKNFGLGQPVEAHELGSAFGGSDTDYYVAMEQVTSSELPAIGYITREPFSVNYNGPMTDAEFARQRKFQWTTEGRNTVAPGHPFLLFKCRSA